MFLWGIFISAFLIGFSGALMPGPMLGIAIDGSLKKGWSAGPLIVLGHGMLELLLIVIMLLGLKDFFSKPAVAGSIGLFGGAYLAWMGYGMMKSGIKRTVSIEKQGAEIRAGTRNFVLAGALVSAANPYFLLWWASTGLELVRQSYALGLTGVSVFFAGHILSDFTWYSAVSFAFSKGKKLISDGVYRWIIIFLGIFIMLFSLYFIGSGLNMLIMQKA